MCNGIVHLLAEQHLPRAKKLHSLLQLFKKLHPLLQLFNKLHPRLQLFQKLILHVQLFQKLNFHFQLFEAEKVDAIFSVLPTFLGNA